MDENIELDEQPNSLDENTATDFSFLEEDESGRDDVIDSVEVPETAPTETVENTDTVETPAVEVESSPYEFLTMSAMENAKSDETEMSPVSNASSVTEMLTNTAMENAATGNQLAQSTKSDDPFADFIPSKPASKEETKVDTTVEDYFSKYNDPMVTAMQNLVENPTPANLDAFYTAQKSFNSPEAREMDNKIANDIDLYMSARAYEKDHPTAATIADKLGDALDKAEDAAREAKKKNEGAAKETKVAPYDEQLFKLAESQVTDPYSDTNFQINELREEIERRTANLAKEEMPDSYRDRQEKMLKEAREELAKYESQLATYQAYYDTYKEKAAAEIKPKEPSAATKAAAKAEQDFNDAIRNRLKADVEFNKATGMEGLKENAESVLNSPDSTAEQIFAAEQLLSAIAKEEGTEASLDESYKKMDEESRKATIAAREKAEELIKEGKVLEATNVLIESSKDATFIDFITPTIDVTKDDGTTKTLAVDEFINENTTAGADMIEELQSLSNPTANEITNIISKFDPTLANFLTAIIQDWTKSNAASGQAYAQRGQALAQQLSDIWENKSNVIQALWDSIKAVVKAAGDFKDITKDTQAYRLIKNAQRLTTRAIISVVAAVTGGPITAIAIWAGSLAKDNLINLVKNTTLDPEIAKIYESFADTQDRNETTDETEGKNYEEGLIKKWDKNDVTIDNKGYNKGLEEKEVSRKELPSDAFVKIIYKKEPWIRKFHV